MKLIDPHLRSATRQPRNYAADEPMHPLQIKAYRAMSVAQKLDRLAELCACATTMLVAGIRMRHPDWSEKQIEQEVRERMLYGVS